MICVDDLGDGFITFPEFQRQLRAYEQNVQEGATVPSRKAQRFDMTEFIGTPTVPVMSVDDFRRFAKRRGWVNAGV